MRMISSFASLGDEKTITRDIVNVFSSNNLWSGFKIEHFIRPAMYVAEHTLSHHTVQFNFGAPLNIAWKSHGKWTTGICNTGSVVGLLSHSEKEEIQWEDEYNSLDISFDPLFIDTLLEKENFRFREQRNISDPFLKDVAAKIHREIHGGFVIEKLYAESLAISCAIHLATTYPVSDKKIFAPKGKLSSYQLKNVIDFVRSSIHGAISLEGLAASIHLSVFHFSRLFKNTIGVSPYQFVLQLKIEYAKRLIKQRVSIGEIAYMLGFTDSAHFCNAFKKIVGQSPLQFYTIP